MQEAKRFYKSRFPAPSTLPLSYAASVQNPQYSSENTKQITRSPNHIKQASSHENLSLKTINVDRNEQLPVLSLSTLYNKHKQTSNQNEFNDLQANSNAPKRKSIIHEDQSPDSLSLTTQNTQTFIPTLNSQDSQQRTLSSNRLHLASSALFTPAETFSYNETTSKFKNINDINLTSSDDEMSNNQNM